MSMSLAGLILLQFNWIKNVYDLAEAQFVEDVMNSIEETASELEYAEAMSLMGPESYRQGLQGSFTDFVKSEFGEVMAAQEAILVRDTIINENGQPMRFLVVTGTSIDTATGLRAEHKVITKDLGQIKPANVDNAVLGLKDSNAFAIQLNQSFERQIMNKANHLNDLMMKMFASNFFDDISLRLNPILLDTLIARNLIARDIDTLFTFNVLDKFSEPVLFKGDSRHYDPDLKMSNFNTQLFPNDLVTGGNQLLVSFPHQESFVWKTLTGTLFASVLLVLIVIFAFYFAVATIYKQKQLSEIKNDFISNMTHELKTPISTISLACEAAQDPDVGADEEVVKSFIQMIDQENKRLSVLVENVLQTALIDKGKLILNLELVNLDRLVRETVNAFQIKYKNKGGYITIDKLDDLKWKVDKVHFGNVITNLLDNSLKYCEKAPEAHLKMIKTESGFSLSVKDNGIGIGKDNQKRIFEKLYRVPTGDVHDVKGFGLGLSYVASIVKLHKGTIELESAIGEGSTFKININHE